MLRNWDWPTIIERVVIAAIMALLGAITERQTPGGVLPSTITEQLPPAAP